MEKEGGSVWTKQEQCFPGVQPHVGAVERKTLGSPQVRQKGLLAGVADNLCFGPRTFFFPAIWPGRVWGLETASVSRAGMQATARAGTPGWGPAG